MYRTTSNPTRGSPAIHLVSVLIFGAIATLLVATCNDEPAALETHDDHAAASLVVEPLELDLEVGDVVTLTATVRCAHGEVVDVRISWSSDATPVARVTGAGQVVAEAFGTAKILAEAGAKTAEVEVSVAPEGTVVGPAGALVSSPDDFFSIEIPPGARTGPTDIIVTQMGAFSDPLYVDGTGFRVLPASLQLSEAARIRIRYEDENVPWGSIEDRLRVYAEEEAPGRWRELDQNEVDLGEHEAEAVTDRLGTFALVPAHSGTITNEGGEVTSADGATSVMVHAEALPDEIDIEISIHRVHDHLYADEPRFVPGTAYEVVFEDVPFSEWAHIRVGYDPLSLPEGVDPADLRVHYWDSSQNLWVEAVDSQVYPAEHEVRAEIEHPAIFALLAAEP